ncbi:sensor histidine kinase [Ottowia sp.]|uniref:sensor histidine kinase n=1 Tax=Ottowia sp. TaxID=1898956 RepID=UPI003A843BCD
MRWPHSLKARLLLILLCSIAGLELLSVGAMGWQRGYDARWLANQHIAQDVLWLHTRLSAMPEAQRPEAIGLMQRGSYHPRLQSAASPVVTAVNTSGIPPQMQALHEAVQAQAGNALPVTLTQAGSQPALRLPLNSAQALLVVFDKTLPGTLPSVRSILLYVLLITGIVTLIASWAVTLVTRPLGHLTTAVRALAADVVSAQPLSGNGSLEIQTLTTGFNAMQRAVQQQLRERTQILAAISHDLKTPLTRLKLRLSSLVDSPSRAFIEADLDAMDTLIDEGLEYARSAQLREQRVPMNIVGLLESLTDQATDLGHNCRFKHPGVRFTVTAAPRALERLLQNLIDNALRYGGQADLSVQASHQGIEVRVSDRGPGVPADQLEHLFEPFVRGEASRGRDAGGTGLGLAIARNTANAHGGRVWLSARQGGGLVAHLWLPQTGTAEAVMR